MLTDWLRIKGRFSQSYADSLGVGNMLDPRVSERIKEAYGYPRAPTTLTEVFEIFRDELNTPRQREFIEKIKSGEAVMAETQKITGYSVILPEGREAKVSCAADPILTSLLRRRGVVRAACPHCREKMEIKIEGNRVANASSPTIVFWLGGGPEKRKGKFDVDVLERGAEEICPHIQLFPNREHLAEWLKSQNDELGVAMSLKETVDSFAHIALAPFLK